MTSRAHTCIHTYTHISIYVSPTCARKSVYCACIHQPFSLLAHTYTYPHTLTFCSLVTSISTSHSQHRRIRWGIRPQRHPGVEHRQRATRNAAGPHFVIDDEPPTTGPQLSFENYTFNYIKPQFHSPLDSTKTPRPSTPPRARRTPNKASRWIKKTITGR